MQVVEDLDTMADVLGTGPLEDTLTQRCIEDLQPFW
jgi:hypothetical protein